MRRKLLRRNPPEWYYRWLSKDKKEQQEFADAMLLLPALILGMVFTLFAFLGLISAIIGQ